MLKDEQYILSLLNNSLSFSDIEKIRIFNYYKDNPQDRFKIRRILEEEQL
jgi:hypothetical protein